MLDFVKNISPVELIAIILILVFLFGSKSIAKFGKTSGETVREIKKVKKEFDKAVGDKDK